MAISNNVTTYGTVAPSVIQKATVLKDPRLQGLNYPIPKNPKNGYFSKSTNLDLVKSNLSPLLLLREVTSTVRLMLLKF